MEPARQTEHRSPSSPVTVERHPCYGSYQKIPGCCREGWRGKAASSCPYDKHSRRFTSGPSNTDERYQPSRQRQTDSIKKRATNTFISAITHRHVSLRGRARAQLFIGHERERKEANIGRLEMEIRPLLLVFILVPPHPPASFWLLTFHSPVSGWEYMTG